MENLQKVISFAHFNEEAFAEMLMDGRKKALEAKQASTKRTLSRQERRIAELDTIIRKLYEDNVCGKLTDERFTKLSAGYEQEQTELAASVQTLRSELAATQEHTGNAEKFLKLVRKYTEPKELTAVMVQEFIEKIIVHAPEKIDGERHMQIDIYLKFIGNFQVPQDEPTAEEMAEEEKQKQRRAKNREKVARCMERKKLKDAQEKEDAAHENDSAV